MGVVTEYRQEHLSTAVAGEKTVRLKALLPPAGRLPDGFAGIRWNFNYVDVRLNVTDTSNIDLYALDLLVSMDTSIAGVGQATDVSSVTFRMPPLPFQSLSANLSDENLKPITLPASPSWQTGAIMPAARVYCEKLLAGETVELVFASVALNPPSGSGPTLRWYQGNNLGLFTFALLSGGNGKGNF